MSQKLLGRLQDHWPSAALADVADRPGSARGRSLARAGALVAAVLLVATYVGLLLWHDTAILTHWLPDALYILNSAWQVHSGFVPNVDFTDRYGGLLTRVVSIGISLAGPSMKALDYTLAILLVISAAMLAVVSKRRLSPVAAIGALLVVMALIVTREPLEQPFALKIASYATLYNRVAWVMLFIAYLVAAVPRSRGNDALALAVAGFATVAMILTKISFGLGVPAIAAAFLLRGARRDCLLWIAATGAWLVAFWIVLGMGPAGWLRMVGAAAHLAGSEPRSAALVKVGFLLAYNGAAVAAILFVSALLAHRERAGALPIVATTLLMFVLSLGIAVTTGLFSLYQTTSPAMAMMAVPILAHLERRRAVEPAYWFPLGFCILSFALPYLANGAWADSRETDTWGIRTNDAGALNSLLIRPAEVLRPRATPLQLSGADLPGDLATFRSLSMLADQDKLLVYRDAVREIVRLPGYRNLGILSPGPRVFPFLVGGKPIASIDLWSTPADFDGAPDRPLPADIDVIAVIRWEILEDLTTTQLMLRRAQRDFTLCRQSAIWNIYLRRSAVTRRAAQGCTATGWAMPIPAPAIEPAPR